MYGGDKATQLRLLLQLHVGRHAFRFGSRLCDLLMASCDDNVDDNDSYIKILTWIIIYDILHIYIHVYYTFTCRITTMMMMMMMMILMVMMIILMIMIYCLQ